MQVKYRLSHRSVQPSKFLISLHLSPDHCWFALLSGRWTWRELNLEKAELGGRRWTWKAVNLKRGELGGRRWTWRKISSEEGGGLGGIWTWRKEVNCEEKLVSTTMTVEAWECPGWKVLKAGTFSGPQFTDPVAHSARVSLSRISTTWRLTQITGEDMLTSPSIRIPHIDWLLTDTDKR